MILRATPASSANRSSPPPARPSRSTAAMAMMLPAAVLLALAAAESPVPIPFEPQLTCEVYKLCHEFASVVQPDITPTQSRAVFDALQLGSPSMNCTKDYAAPPAREALPEPAPRVSRNTGSAATTIYVDATKGRDSAAGSQSAPLKSVEAAVAKTRTGGASGATIILRAGTYYLKETLALTAKDSGLTIESYSGCLRFALTLPSVFAVTFAHVFTHVLLN